ncbi:MAG: carbohydrate kinase [Microbacterium sp. 71-36]|uniref:gluconokinase n=1 Tax=unclassified Microbacterium TaxID=2609290 RepID=UPI00086A3241|nr:MULTISPECIES: gluconokinase [unclassified Microbacterium]MBN9210814.1 gluconokinase [Microbacterium sp.]ODT42154.1 MAG: carbohydrate kinase [Microbacterium sp. SCN 71-17]OJV77446.1 MAG: carbohydrate kinase [Microbacterium sp. 71-36]
MTATAPILVFMGPAGTGKSTVAGMLAGRLGWDLQEGDDLHPAVNVAKMAAGHALDDDDRWPWLDRVAGWIDGQIAAGRPGVITCSALKRSYRDVLRRDGVTFVLLMGDPKLVLDRLLRRQGHFMPPALLASQFETLEIPGADERAIHVDLDLTPQQQVDAVIAQLHLAPAT